MTNATIELMPDLLYYVRENDGRLVGRYPHKKATRVEWLRAKKKTITPEED
ncbi:MAG: hypothetical protein V3R78_12580 [Thermodesulfobacteriota bacterium]